MGGRSGAWLGRSNMEIQDTHEVLKELGAGGRRKNHVLNKRVDMALSAAL